MSRYISTKMRYSRSVQLDTVSIVRSKEIHEWNRTFRPASSGWEREMLRLEISKFMTGNTKGKANPRMRVERGKWCHLSKILPSWMPAVPHRVAFKILRHLHALLETLRCDSNRANTQASRRHVASNMPIQFYSSSRRALIPNDDETLWPRSSPWETVEVAGHPLSPPDDEYTLWPVFYWNDLHQLARFLFNRFNHIHGFSLIAWMIRGWLQYIWFLGP
jgi:hypothetical protein